MKHPFTNLFTAPDAADILRDRKLTVRNAVLLLGAGVAFLSTLVGGYTLGTWFLVQTMGPATTSQTEIPEAADSVSFPEPPSLEERQQSLSKIVGSSTSPEERAERQDATAALMVEPSLNERQRALESLKR